MKNQTPQTQTLALQFPYIVAFGKYNESPTHEIVQELWRAKHFNVPNDTVSVNKVNGEPVITSIDQVNIELWEAILTIAETVEEAKPKLIKRSQSISLDIETDIAIDFELDFSTLEVA